MPQLPLLHPVVPAVTRSWTLNQAIPLIHTEFDKSKKKREQKTWHLKNSVDRRRRGKADT